MSGTETAVGPSRACGDAVCIETPFEPKTDGLMGDGTQRMVLPDQDARASVLYQAPYAISLCTRYAIFGTDLAYGADRPPLTSLSQVEEYLDLEDGDTGSSLRPPYEMSGTDLARTSPDFHYQQGMEQGVSRPYAGPISYALPTPASDCGGCTGYNTDVPHPDLAATGKIPAQYGALRLCDARYYAMRGTEIGYAGTRAGCLRGSGTLWRGWLVPGMVLGIPTRRMT
eukprot:1661989-Rhodomonas_salina.1